MQSLFKKPKSIVSINKILAQMRENPIWIGSEREREAKMKKKKKHDITATTTIYAHK